MLLLSCRCCYYKVVNGDDAALHQLHPLRCDHLPAISILLRKIRTTALIVEEVPSSASSIMCASVTQIGWKMIAETSVLFVSVKKVFDTTTLETLHRGQYKLDPILVLRALKLALFKAQCFCNRCCHRSCHNQYWKKDHYNSNRNDCDSLGRKKEWQDCPGAKIVHELVAVLLSGSFLPWDEIVSTWGKLSWVKIILQWTHFLQVTLANSVLFIFWLASTCFPKCQGSEWKWPAHCAMKYDD